MSICGFILAAGAGTRMRPATLLRPKALLPFCGKPLLDLAWDEMDTALPDASPVIVNACYLSNQVKQWVDATAPHCNRPLHCSLEDRLLNHGGGIRKGILEFVPDTDEILVRNVDVVTDFNIRDLLEEHHTSGADATVLLIDNQRQDGVAVNQDGTISQFHSGKSGYTFAGIYILNRCILNFLTPNVDAPSIITAFERAAQNGCRIQALLAPKSCWWSDVGTYGEYIQAHRQAYGLSLDGHFMLQTAVAEQSRRRLELQKKGVILHGAIGLGCNLDITPGACLHDVIVWDNVRLAVPMLYSSGVICTSPLLPPPASASEHVPAPELRDAFALEWTDEEDNLPKQGSGRKYCRVKTKDGFRVWSAYEPYVRWENSSFAALANLMRSIGIRVPRIYAHSPEKCELLLQDLGPEDLLAEKDETRRREYLLQTMEQLARLHTLGTAAILQSGIPLQPTFTLGLYEWERDYFRERLLDGVFAKPALWKLAADEHAVILNALLHQPLVPLHRDFQSANIKIHEGKTWMIDFQGMRLGAAAYDLASLLYDPYAPCSETLRGECIDEYRRQAKLLGGSAPPASILPLAAIQRLMQALGAYGKLWKLDGLDWYRKYIPAAAKNLLEAAQSAHLEGYVSLAGHILALCNEMT